MNLLQGEALIGQLPCIGHAFEITHRAARQCERIPLYRSHAVEHAGMRPEV
jgi:hypothetical protein